MMLLTGVTLRRMDPDSSSAPSLPSPTRSSALAASATASLGAAIATTPRPSIRDVLAARPPRRRTTGEQANTHPAVLSSALEAANAPILGAAVGSTAAAANTVAALKNARAARAAGLRASVQGPTIQGPIIEDRLPAAAGAAVEQAPTSGEASVGDDVQLPAHASSKGLVSRILHQEDKPTVQPGPQQDDEVASAASSMLTAMGLIAQPAAVEARYDMWKVS